MFWVFDILKWFSILFSIIGMIFFCFGGYVVYKRLKHEKNIRKEVGLKNVFIAYSSKKQSLAKKICLEFHLQGFQVSMWNPEQLFSDPLVKITDFIDNATALIIIDPSNMSSWIKGEVSYAKLTEKDIYKIDRPEEIDFLLEEVINNSSINKALSVSPKFHYDLIPTTLGRYVEKDEFARSEINNILSQRETSKNVLAGMWMISLTFFFLSISLYIILRLLAWLFF